MLVIQVTLLPFAQMIQITVDQICRMIINGVLPKFILSKIVSNFDLIQIYDLNISTLKRLLKYCEEFSIEI